MLTRSVLQEMHQNDCLLSDLMAKAELAEISEGPAADHSVAACHPARNPFPAKLLTQAKDGFQHQLSQSWVRNHAPATASSAVFQTTNAA